MLSSVERIAFARSACPRLWFTRLEFTNLLFTQGSEFYTRHPFSALGLITKYAGFIVFSTVPAYQSSFYGDCT